jgi:membrane-bound lytic murein transglycosylase B
MYLFKGYLTLFLLLILSWNTSFAAEKFKPFADRKEVRQFILEMHKKHGLDKKTLTTLFKEYGPEQKVLDTMSKQYEALPWFKYKDLIVTKERIKEGVLFWKQNETSLKNAEKTFGVPAEIIVAIIGLETSYGKKMGNYPLIQSLSTLAFNYPRRADFFRGELEHFLLLVNEGALDARTAKGSFAGAIGIPQFMPSSYRRFAVDFSGKGKRDLLYDNADAIGSVGNYLNLHGWEPKEHIAHKVRVSGTLHEKIVLTKSAIPDLTLNDLEKHRVKLHTPRIMKDKTKKVNLIALQKSEKSKEHWIGLHNFYVITRYNHSIHYAMAVYQLSQNIRTQKQG